MMLASSRLQGFVQTTDAARARDFYRERLGLPLLTENEFVMVFGVRDSAVLVQKVSAFTPAAATVLGWNVDDILQAVSALGARGVKFERYGWLQQDALGIWTAPDGGKVAWFKDPDGNTLSVSQH
ncbi:MAG TPA: VOC family protein [Terriglobia bacterium]|nr:VOC family protein [Terriglobia bacterium]